MQYACNGECYRSPFFEVPHCGEPTYRETGEYADDEHGADDEHKPPPLGVRSRASGRQTASGGPQGHRRRAGNLADRGIVRDQRSSRRLRRDQKARQRGCVEAWLEPGVCGAGARLIEDHDGWLRPGTLLKRSSGRRLHAAFHDRFA